MRLNNSESPIFVIGTPRSGTTLVARILGKHSNIFAPGETHFFDDIYSRRIELGQFFDQNTKFRILKRLSSLYGRFNEPDDQKRIEFLFQKVEAHRFIHEWSSYKDVLDSFMSLQANGVGKNRWVNHTPRDIFNIDKVLSFYPDAKIIVCVRDLRDFLLSYKNKWRATSPEEVERLKKLYHPVITSLLWKLSMKRLPQIIKKVPSKNLLVVKYEDLVQAPDRTVKQLCKTIEESFEQNMLVVQSYASSHGTNKSGIFASSVGRWQTQLSNEEIWIAQRIASKEMHEHGYSITNCTVNILQLIYMLLNSPSALYRGLKANSTKRGPLVAYLYKRIVSKSTQF